MIQSVDMNNNVATIYLIKGNTKVNVEKAWTSRDHTEAEVNVQLQRRKTDAEGWQKVENTVLNEGKNGSISLMLIYIMNFLLRKKIS